MVKLSEKTIKLLKDDILTILYDKFPQSLFTYEIAKELRRDKEFTKKLLQDLEQQNLVEKIIKNKRGYNYIKRIKWRIPVAVVKAYKNG